MLKLRIYYLIFLLLLTAFISCKEAEENREPQKDYFENNQRFLSVINLDNIPTVELNSQASESFSDWREFLSAHSEVEKIKNSTLHNFIGNADNLAEVILQMKDSLPEAHQNRAINSRLNVLETKVKVMQQNLERPQRSAELIEKDAEEIYAAFQNLKIQINELFLPQLEDLDFDIDTKQDSIRRARQKKLPADSK